MQFFSLFGTPNSLNKHKIPHRKNKLKNIYRYIHVAIVPNGNMKATLRI